jgi:hypothetical protein
VYRDRHPDRRPVLWDVYWRSVSGAHAFVA